MKIRLTLVTEYQRHNTGRNFKTLASARRYANKVVGLNPRLDCDGYVVNRANGDCLFVDGATVGDIFPCMKEME